VKNRTQKANRRRGSPSGAMPRMAQRLSQPRRGLRGRQAFGALVGIKERRTTRGMASGASCAKSTERNQKRLLERPVRRNTTRNPSPAAAPAGKAKKKRHREQRYERKRETPAAHCERTQNKKNEGAAARYLRAARFSAKTKETVARLWRRKSRDKVTGTLAPHVKTQLGRASARTRREPKHQQPERKFFKRKKSDQQVRPAIWTKIKAKNSQKKFSDLVST
jgi:hypothetical protein